MIREVSDVSTATGDREVKQTSLWACSGEQGCDREVFEMPGNCMQCGKPLEQLEHVSWPAVRESRRVDRKDAE